MANINKWIIIRVLKSAKPNILGNALPEMVYYSPPLLLLVPLLDSPHLLSVSIYSANYTISARKAISTASFFNFSSFKTLFGSLLFMLLFSITYLTYLIKLSL